MFKNTHKVKVVAGENGDILQPNSNKPEYGSVRLDQTVFTYRNGFLDRRNKVTFMAGRMEALNEFLTSSNVKAGSELPGCLYTVESFSPLYEGHQPKINPTNGRAVLVDSAMVYEQTYYDETGTKTDSYLDGERTAGEVIKDPTSLKKITDITSMLS